MAYRDFHDLPERTTSNTILCDKEFSIAKNLKYDGYQRDLASMVSKFFDKISSGSIISAKRATSKILAAPNRFVGDAVEREIISNQKLPKELHKAIIRKFEKGKCTHLLRRTFWGVFLADMQLLSTVKIINNFVFHYALSTFSVNTHGLFL